MKLMTHQRLRMFGGACLLALLSAVAMPVVPSWAKAPAGPTATLPRKMYSKSQAFNLPIQMEEVTRQSLQKVQLWVKAPGAPAWCRQDEVAPTEKEFSYRATQDGE